MLLLFLFGVLCFCVGLWGGVGVLTVRRLASTDAATSRRRGRSERRRRLLLHFQSAQFCVDQPDHFAVSEERRVKAIWTEGSVRAVVVDGSYFVFCDAKRRLCTVYGMYIIYNYVVVFRCLWQEIERVIPTDSTRSRKEKIIQIMGWGGGRGMWYGMDGITLYISRIIVRKQLESTPKCVCVDNKPIHQHMHTHAHTLREREKEDI